MTLKGIKEKLKNLPMSPGVYLMRDKDGNVIYVGKSKVLKNRVSQYFMDLKSHTAKTFAMVSHVADFDYIMTDSEVEALILECNLIKKYKPQYNILLKDDKHYPYIKITTKEDYPRLIMTRKLVNDGSKYFGPYMSSLMVKNALETLRKIFKVRSCSKKIHSENSKDKPCLYYHIGQCSAPCGGKISMEEYREGFEQISDVLEGKYQKITKDLTEKMYYASDNLEFERAARYRDKIESIKMLGEKQKMISTKEDNRDIIAVFRGDYDICIDVFYMRDGKIQGSEYYVFAKGDGIEEDNVVENGGILSEFIKQYYFNTTNIPREILVSEPFDDMESVQCWLSEKTGHKITVSVPQRGEKASLVRTVLTNAEESLKQHYFKVNREKLEQNKVLTDLVEVLNLRKTPFRIESYDISNISGSGSIGVCVVYNKAKASKKDYRKFNIKTVEGSDDYESTREVISRRINRAYDETNRIENGTLNKEDAKFLPLPDLILLDGGVGHVNAVRTLMDTLGEDIPVYGLSKDDRHRTRALVDTEKEYKIDKDSGLFLFLTDLQEEVHRYAITSFRKKYVKSAVASELEKISGIGEARRKKLLSSFVSVEHIKKASIDELSEVLDKKSAQNVYDFFNGNAERINNGDDTSEQ